MASRDKVGVKTDRGQRATGEELGSKRAVFSVEEGHVALVVLGKFAGADAEGLGAIFQELVRNSMLRFPESYAKVRVQNKQE